MSYSKVKSFSFMSNFEGVKITSACNNVQPLDYNAWQQLKNSREDLKIMTSKEYVIYWIKGFLDGSLQFNNENNVLYFTMNKVLLENGFNSFQDTWESIYDYKSWDWDSKTFKDENDKIDYENKQAKIQDVYEKIADAIINKKYNGLFSNLKKESYVLKNANGCFITSLSRSSYRYLGNQSKAKVFTGLQKETLKHHFAITRDHFNFEVISA